MPQGTNSDCQWPDQSHAHALDADPKHFAYDFEVAEELSIRYADEAKGSDLASFSGIVWRTKVGDVARFDSLRNECAARLFTQIALSHGVPTNVVSTGAGAGKRGANLPVNIPLVVV